jgi:hypothetical protein
MRPSLMLMPSSETSGMLCLKDGDGDRDGTPEIAPSLSQNQSVSRLGVLRIDCVEILSPNVTVPLLGRQTLVTRGQCVDAGQSAMQ